jgi:hypothetical protein
MTAREATIQLPITDPAKLELTNINVDSTDAKGRGPARGQSGVGHQKTKSNERERHSCRETSESGEL